MRTCGPNREKKLVDCNWIRTSVTHLELFFRLLCTAHCNRLKQCATLPRLQIGKLYVCWFSRSCKTKESSFAVFQENETFLEKNSCETCHLLLDVIRHAHAKFAPLNFINKKNEKETPQTERPLCM